MIYITGDCHGNFERFREDIFPEQKEMTKDDYVIICGDFGGIWKRDPLDEAENAKLDALERRPFTTLFVDGNHENFDRLYGYPVERWNGGKIHRIRPSVIHLMRGQVFELQGKKFFTFGGATSHDVQGGILDPADPDFLTKLKLTRVGTLPFRIRHYSWWEQEMPSKTEQAEGLRNLEANDWTVDYVITHGCSSATQTIIGRGLFKPDILSDYLDTVREKASYKKWFFGHYHNNVNVNKEEIMLYEQIIRIR